MSIFEDFSGADVTHWHLCHSLQFVFKLFICIMQAWKRGRGSFLLQKWEPKLQTELCEMTVKNTKPYVRCLNHLSSYRLSLSHTQTRRQRLKAGRSNHRGWVFFNLRVCCLPVRWKLYIKGSSSALYGFRAGVKIHYIVTKRDPPTLEGCRDSNDCCVDHLRHDGWRQQIIQYFPSDTFKQALIAASLLTKEMQINIRTR